ncbi:MAG TPA: hypothetical protein VI790_00935 [Candidatus Nanoarchaeia archaeon]|nr:hypothetical protein [Candidatus Nanoarchaeia archaeon]
MKGFIFKKNGFSDEEIELFKFRAEESIAYFISKHINLKPKAKVLINDSYGAYFGLKEKDYKYVIINSPILTDDEKGVSEAKKNLELIEDKLILEPKVMHEYVKNFNKLEKIIITSSLNSNKFNSDFDLVFYNLYRTVDNENVNITELELSDYHSKVKSGGYYILGLLTFLPVLKETYNALIDINQNYGQIEDVALGTLSPINSITINFNYNSDEINKLENAIEKMSNAKPSDLGIKEVTGVIAQPFIIITKIKVD